MNASVKTMAFGNIRAITAGGPRKTVMEKSAELRHVVVPGEAERIAEDHVKFRNSIFSQARGLVEEARAVSALERKAISMIAKEKPENQEIMARFFLAFNAQEIEGAMLKYSQAISKLDVHDLDLAARIGAIVASDAAKLGDHEHAAYFYSMAAHRKLRSAIELNREPGEFGSGPDARIARKRREAISLFGKAITHYVEMYDSLRCTEENGDTYMNLKKAIAVEVVGHFREAFGLSYKIALKAWGKENVETARDVARNAVEQQRRHAFDVTTPFTDLRDDVLNITTFPWTVYRQ